MKKFFPVLNANIIDSLLLVIVFGCLFGVTSLLRAENPGSPTILLLEDIPDSVAKSSLAGSMLDDWQCRGLYVLNNKYHYYLFSSSDNKGEWYDSTRDFSGRKLLGFDVTSNHLIFITGEKIERIAMSAKAKLSDYFVATPQPKPASQVTMVTKEDSMRPKPRRVRMQDEEIATAPVGSFTMLLHDRMQQGFIPVQVSLAKSKPLTDGSAIAYPEGALSTFSPEMVRSMDKDQLEGYMAEYEGIRDVPATPESMEAWQEQAVKAAAENQQTAGEP